MPAEQMSRAVPTRDGNDRARAAAPQKPNVLTYEFGRCTEFARNGHQGTIDRTVRSRFAFVADGLRVRWW